MKVFSIDVRVYATAYIKADSAEEALALAKAMQDSTLTVTDAGSEVAISGVMLASDDLPRVSLSPAMTVYGPEDGFEPSLAEVTEIAVDPR